MVYTPSLRTWTPAILGLVVLALYSVFYSDYVFSSFLTDDDNIFVPLALFGQAGIPANSPGRFIIIFLGGLTGSIAVVKAMGLIFYPLIAILCLAIIRQTGADWLPAALFALLIVTFPAAVHQPYFISGAHPGMGGAFGLAALLVFLRSYDEPDRFRNAFIGSMVLSVIAAAFSPQMFLFPAVPILWAAAALAFGQIQIRQFILATAVVGPLVLITGYFAYRSHHYGGIVGWTDFSLPNVLGNLIEVLSRPIETILDQDLLLRGLYLALLLCFGGLTAFAIFRRDPEATIDSPLKRCGFVFVLCGLAAGLAFGPVSITTAFIERYDAPLFLFGALAFLAPAATLWRRLSMPGAIVVALIIAVVVGWNMQVRLAMVDAADGASLKAHQRVARIVSRDSENWPPDSQVAFIVEKPRDPATRGYNHWSTWYLRGLAGRDDLIGLVGRDTWISRDPFVDAYRDHGDEYWEVINGRSRRIPMIGLEAIRPLFVYGIKEGDELPSAKTIVFPSRNHLLIVPPGTAPESAVIVADGDPFSLTPDEYDLWPSNIAGFGPAEGDCKFDPEPSQVSSRLTVSLTGEEAIGIDLPIQPGACVDLALLLKPATAVTTAAAYSETAPPMPTAGPMMSIYQLSSGYVVGGLKHDGSTVMPHAGGDQVLELKILGREGAWFELLSGARSYSLEVKSLPKTLVLGKGFKERYWSGEIEVQLSIDYAPVPPSSIGVHAISSAD